MLTNNDKLYRPYFKQSLNSNLKTIKSTIVKLKVMFIILFKTYLDIMQFIYMAILKLQLMFIRL